MPRYWQRTLMEKSALKAGHNGLNKQVDPNSDYHAFYFGKILAQMASPL
jgi:hypothetical protein